ncbi:hypothetical protein [Planococcus rifietoensis]|uniref:hypothetical protein n=1 Tax=Planococcus rifietoensis TaxID=200991 RepID=UPI00384C0206
MLKKNVKIALAVVLFFSIKDLLSGGEIQWVNTLVFGIIIFLFFFYGTGQKSLMIGVSINDKQLRTFDIAHKYSVYPDSA